MAVGGWGVTFGTARRGLGGVAARPTTPPRPSSLYQNHSPPTVFRLNREDMLRDHTYNGAKVGKETYESRLKRGTHYPRSQPVNMHE